MPETTADGAAPTQSRFRDATASAAAKADRGRASRLTWLLGLLAVLLAATAGTRAVDDGRVLRHAAFGRAVLDGAFPPPSVETWTTSAEGRPWANVTWLFDTVLAATHAAAGPMAWSVLGGIAAVSLVLVGVSAGGATKVRAIVPIALAVAAYVPFLRPTPELLTPLGVACVTAAAVSFARGGSPLWLFAVVPLTALWANADERAGFGPAVLLLYLAAEAIGAAIGRPGFASASRRLTFGVVAGLSLLALGAGPFPLSQWTAAVDLFAVHDTAARGYLSATATLRPAIEPFWFGATSFSDLLTKPGVAAGLLLAAWSVGGVWVARRDLAPAEIVLSVAFAAVGCVTLRELPVAAAGLAVVTIGVARGRRGDDGDDIPVPGTTPFAAAAVTLVAFGGLLVSGFLPGPGGTPVGFGLTPAFADEVDELAAALENPLDDRPFNFRPQEGDVLIWLGRKPFVDTRFGLFADDGTEGGDLLSLHDRVRYALLTQTGSAPESKADFVGQSDVWRAAFDRFDIDHVVVRLSQPNPAYFVHIDLLLEPTWRMTRLTGSASIFYRTDGGEEVDAYLAENGLRFVELAFAPGDRQDGVATAARPGWARPPLSDGFLPFASAGSVRIPAAEQRARHYLTHLKLASNANLRIAPDLLLAFAHLAIRDLDVVLAEDVTRAAPYRILGEVYRELDRVETAIATAAGGRPVTRRRLYQALNALGQARSVEPDDPATLLALMQTYRSYGKFDLALDALDRYREREGGASATPVPSGESEAGSAEAAGRRDAAFDAMRTELVRALDPTTALIAKAAEQGVAPMEIATAAWQRGATRAALELLATMTEQTPPAARLRALLLLEAGQPAGAAAILEALAKTESGASDAATAEPLALVSLGLARYAEAATLWDAIADEATFRAFGGTLTQGPLVGTPEGKPPFASWAASVEGLLSRTAAEVGLARINAALCELEAGRTDTAVGRFESVVDGTPPNPVGPLAAVYARLIRSQSAATE